jgi:hypothetical protein
MHDCWVHIIISEVAFDVDELELESGAWRTSLTRPLKSRECGTTLRLSRRIENRKDERGLVNISAI